MYEDIIAAVRDASRMAREQDSPKAITVHRWTPGKGLAFTYNVFDPDTAREYAAGDPDAYVMTTILPRDRGHDWRNAPVWG
jgi:hypothetical protein